MRLIDADDLAAKIMMDAPDFMDGGSSITKAFILAMLKTKSVTPTIDAVPIVRCKDCKYCEYPKAEKEWCKKGHLHGNAENWFCADGEQKIETESEKFTVGCENCALRECEGHDGMIVCDRDGESHEPDYVCKGYEKESLNGEWLPFEDEDCNAWQCSVCHEPQIIIDGTPGDNSWYYCPHCGAKLTGETDEVHRESKRFPDHRPDISGETAEGHANPVRYREMGEISGTGEGSRD